MVFDPILADFLALEGIDAGDDARGLRLRTAKAGMRIGGAAGARVWIDMDNGEDMARSAPLEGTSVQETLAAEKAMDVPGDTNHLEPTQSCEMQLSEQTVPGTRAAETAMDVSGDMEHPEPTHKSQKFL
ncbi:hypothetical protein BDZ91DRAFT_762210 [Kalaharituber pfeilii]|nr:hypothetical protein BDZ91DRAFT_762210 [Kalaharituber pfeilii]